MSSPNRLLQLQSVYTISSAKLASPSRKRKPSERKPGAAGLSPLPGQNEGKLSCSKLSPKQWKQWMHEAQQLNVSASVYLAKTSSETLVQAANEGLELVVNPTVARTSETLASLIQARALDLSNSAADAFAQKHSPAADSIQKWRACITKPKKRRVNVRVRIEPLMRAKLQAHLESKIKGDIWENEIRSRLARPLSSSAFCSRSEQLRHPLSAAQFVNAVVQADNAGTAQSMRPTSSSSSGTNSVTPKFPYSVEAHAFIHVARREKAARRVAHLRRWAAKTRVCLFVHQTWTISWFRSKRKFNVDGMKHELAALEASDHNVHLEFSAIFATPLGKDMLKKTLAQWRVGAQRRAAQGASALEKDSNGYEADVDPVVVRLRQCFQIFDLDGSGTLDLDEFQLMLSYLRGKKQQQPSRGGKRSVAQTPKLTTTQVRNLFAELDCDGNGGITCAEFERWWAKEHERTTLSTSASTNFFSRGLDGLLLQSHGLLFWLLGRKQQLERKFVKKLMVRRAMDSAKRDILHREIDQERVAGVSSKVFRCRACGRRFGLRRDLADHVAHECTSTQLVVDTFSLKRWVHEEEFRLLENVKGDI
ncbi:unnamed protein product [Phytophthora lilii]|uniref:Unnamed protein product n=1 Tax=Phytophthora lilii TaxID=2077276 RepID=A0A9W7D941_9STRA|nr:unnamed protein product [Phytophthora lilii]